MPTIYSKADHTTLDFIQEVLADYHERLVNAEVTVDALFAESSDDKPPVKHHGYPAAAVIKINGVKERLRGLADATITIDRGEWDGHGETWCRALIDHELTHLEVQYDPDNPEVPRTDDAGRPRLKLRVHDFELGIFDQIIRRHGDDSPDAMAIQKAAGYRVDAAEPIERTI